MIRLGSDKNYNNPATNRSTYQIMESSVKQSQVKICEVGGRLSSHGSLLLRVWLLSAFGETTCDFLKAMCYVQRIISQRQYEWDAGYFRDCNGVSNGASLPWETIQVILDLPRSTFLPILIQSLKKIRQKRKLVLIMVNQLDLSGLLQTSFISITMTPCTPTMFPNTITIMVSKSYTLLMIT